MKGILSIFFLFASCMVLAQQPVNPEIRPYGSMVAITDDHVKADPMLPYNIVVEVKGGDTLSGEVNASLDAVARMVNMLGHDGITKEKRSIVVIVHNMGAYMIQHDEAFQRKYGRKNPNTDIIRQLKDAGVQFMICGQSAVRRKIGNNEMLPGIQMTTSFLTTFTTLQLKGYAALSF